MKKHSKKIAFAILVMLSVLMFSTQKTRSPQKVAGITETLPSTTHKEVPVLIERYGKKESQKVAVKLDSLLERINKRNDFHGSVLVAKNGKVLYDNHIGYADFRKKEPLSKASTFQLASVGKQFTAAAIMILYERHQIKLTDTINTYFPKFPYEGVTIKNLLNHTAGLPKYFWITEHKWKGDKSPTNEELMSLLETSDVLRFFKPGHKFDYSNTGYAVLASIVEIVSGTSFSDFVQQNIFVPLGMKDSFIYSYNYDEFRENQLAGYRLYRGWKHLKIGGSVNDAIVGDKNIYATSEDLFKWVHGLNNGKILSKTSLDLMYTEGETIFGRKVPYGFGFRIDTNNSNTIYHYGKWNGFSTALTQYPDDELVVIVLEHTSFTGLTSLNKKIKNIVLKNFDS